MPSPIDPIKRGGNNFVSDDGKGYVRTSASKKKHGKGGKKKVEEGLPLPRKRKKNSPAPPATEGGSSPT